MTDITQEDVDKVWRVVYAMFHHSVDNKISTATRDRHLSKFFQDPEKYTLGTYCRQLTEILLSNQHSCWSLIDINIDTGVCAVESVRIGKHSKVTKRRLATLDEAPLELQGLAVVLIQSERIGSGSFIPNIGYREWSIDGEPYNVRLWIPWSGKWRRPNRKSKPK